MSTKEGTVDVEDIQVDSPSTLPSEHDNNLGHKMTEVSKQEETLINGEQEQNPLKSEITSSLPDFTIDRDAAVKIRILEKSSGVASEEPVTVLDSFDKTVKRFANVPALREERDGQWVTWTYSEYQQDVFIAAKAFIQLGLEPYNGVGIIGFNSPEWMISDLGAIHACGLATGIYATNTPETCLFVASDAQINILVAENDFQVQKFLGIWDQLPGLKAIIQYKGELKEKKDNLYTWNEFMEIGRNCDDAALKKRMEMQMPNKCCTLIYTSGTTGNPKGVMLSHDNITFSAKLLMITVGDILAEEEERHVVSYLPLSHIAAQIVDIYGSIIFGTTVSYAKADALKGSLGATLKAVRPTLFLGVPRVFEKIEERMKQIGQSITGLKKKIGTWAKGVALRANMNKEKGQSTPLGFTVANIFLKKARVQLGLDRCKLICTAAAPISLDTLRYFQSINIPLLELYGMSECTGCATISLPGMVRTTAVGTCLPHVEISILNQEEDGSGEICMRGRFVLMGYLENMAKTEECIDKEGWLHSGDIGRFDEDGFLYITGRIKELIITAGGENIAPVPIEDNIKAELPFISNAMVIGDKKKFLSVVLTPKIEMDPETGAPTRQLAAATKSFCEQLGIEVSDVSQIAPVVPEAIDQAINAGINKANDRATSRASKVQKYTLLPTDFSIDGGELGPTLKLRRPHVTKKFKETIDSIYE